MTDQVTLSAPITIGTTQVSALTVDKAFRVGWLRGAPKTPGWPIAVIKAVLSGLPDDLDATKISPAELLKGVEIPQPSGEEVSEMIPWLLHVAAKATGQPDAVIDQLSPKDLLMILLKLMPGMGALQLFTGTPGSGSETSPGSSGGPHGTSTT